MYGEEFGTMFISKGFELKQLVRAKLGAIALYIASK